MTAGAVHMDRSILHHIEAHAQSVYPRESCGLLLGARFGAGWQVSGIEESRNVAPDDRNDRFEIDPALLLRVQKSARAGGKPMMGIYHSHPNGAAIPSQTDLDNAWQIGMLWMITALDIAQIETRAYVRDEAGFAPISLKIIEAIE